MAFNFHVGLACTASGWRLGFFCVLRSRAVFYWTTSRLFRSPRRHPIAGGAKSGEVTAARRARPGYWAAVGGLMLADFGPWPPLAAVAIVEDRGIVPTFATSASADPRHVAGGGLYGAAKADLAGLKRWRIINSSITALEHS